MDLFLLQKKVSEVLNALKKLQYPTGLFAAAGPEVKTGYHLAWVRDTVYSTFGLEISKNWPEIIRAHHALLDVFKKHEYKIDWMIKEPQPKQAWRYIHARYRPFSGDEIWEDWGNKQNDAIGLFLFNTGRLHKKGVPVLRSQEDYLIIQKLVDYLESIEYWRDTDNGIWEEQEQLHASSIGACIAGLKAVQQIARVPNQLILLGEQTLKRLLPLESPNRKEDLALLSLIYPFNVVSSEQEEAILRMVEENLVRQRGVIRYFGDKYYHCGVSEAEWTLGFCWLAIIYKQKKQAHKHSFYLRKATEAINEKGELPELYYGNTSLHNENSPLAWAHSLYLVASGKD